MKFLVRDRAWGKSRRVLEWWLEDPHGRYVICSSQAAAESMAIRALDMLFGRGANIPNNPHGVRSSEVHSHFQVFNPSSAWAFVGKHDIEVAIDNLDLILPRFLGLNGTSGVSLITATGDLVE